jgi:glycine/D-amino acid oxidase-like deaminating enzyme
LIAGSDAWNHAPRWPFAEMENLTDRRSRSLWMDIDVAPYARPLQGGKECDVVVIGSGIAGISTAYELAIEGQRVIVVDRGRIAGGITSRTSAHLAPLCDDLTSAMISLRGEEASRLFYESQAAAGRPDRRDSRAGGNRLRFSPPRWLPVPGAKHRFKDHR